MLFVAYVLFHILVKFGYLSERLLQISCSLDLRYVFLVKVPDYKFSVFPSRASEWEFLSDRVITYSPWDGYTPLSPPRGTFGRYDFLIRQYLRHKMRHISPLRSVTLPCYIKITYVTQTLLNDLIVSMVKNSQNQFHGYL